MWDKQYRPLKFTDVLGQPGTVQLLKARLRNRSALSTSYIFSGSHGCGKTTLSRILGRALLCQQLNLEDPEPCNECDNCRDILSDTSVAYVEQDAASKGTIDNIRGIVDDLPFAVVNASKRVYVFDECHRMSKDAQDVLLKPIEESKLVAILCTTEAEKIRGTIRSRCEEYTIRKITREDILARMQSILTQQGVAFQDDAILTVIDYSGGHVRDVLNRLEMLSQMGEVTIENVREYLRLSVVSTYYKVLLALGDAKQAVELVEQACEQVPPDEVSAGLAEAAMNSFRLKKGLHAEFVAVDRALAQQVYERFGDEVVRLAEYFIRSKHTTQLSLICDVLGLVQQGGVPTQQVALIPSPVVLAVAAPAVVAPAVVACSTVEHATTEQHVQPVAEVPTTVSVSQQPLPKGKTTGERVDGIGNLGVDPLALTMHDVQAIPRDKPRSIRDPVPLFTLTRTGSDNEVLLPDMWSREFELSWLAMFPGKSS